MFLRHKVRRKDGKQHRYWSIVENRRASGGRTVQRHVLYLGEINDAQRAAWCRTIEAFDENGQQALQIALFPEDRQAPALNCDVVHVRLSGLRLHRPRQWGACWLACHVWDQLRLDDFWSPRLPASREGTRWLDVLKTLVAYRLIDPGSEWRLHRQWYERSAMGDLLGADFTLAHKDNLYRCLDRLLMHKADLFSFLQQRWKSPFGADFEALLYDLTSTYFECDPPEAGKRLWLQPGQTFGLRAGGHCVGRDTGRPAAGLRGDGGQHLGQDNAARLSPADRGPVWQGQAHLGDGPRHPDGGGAGGNAGVRAAGPAFRRHATRTPRATGAGFSDKPRTDVRDAVQAKLVEQDDHFMSCPQRRAPGQGRGDAAAATRWV